jgi:phage head maturation protease
MKNNRATPTEAPLLTPVVIRKLAKVSQVQVAAAAGTGVATVRVYELDPDAVQDAEKRRALGKVYARLREQWLAETAA